MPPKLHIRIATRQSEMALAQTQMVAEQLEAAWPGLTTELVKVSTTGDEITDRPLADIGGKALFIKGLELALLNNQADIAVHSVKDIPAQLESAFLLAAVLERPSPFDALVAQHAECFDELPEGAVIGTSSPRRQAQLLHRRSDLTVKSVRGNVNTRLSKLRAGEYDALILGVAGLARIQKTHEITEILSAKHHLPSAGQGAIGIEIHQSREDLLSYILPLNHEASFAAVTAERAMVAALQGNCHSPIGAYATWESGQLQLEGSVLSLDGRHRLSASVQHQDPVALGEEVARQLSRQGATQYL